jgi:hypothetical protein
MALFYIYLAGQFYSLEYSRVSFSSLERARRLMAHQYQYPVIVSLIAPHGATQNMEWALYPVYWWALKRTYYYFRVSRSLFKLLRRSIADYVLALSS